MRTRLSIPETRPKALRHRTLKATATLIAWEIPDRLRVWGGRDGRRPTSPLPPGEGMISPPLLELGRWPIRPPQNPGRSEKFPRNSQFGRTVQGRAVAPWIFGNRIRSERKDGNHLLTSATLHPSRIGGVDAGGGGPAIPRPSPMGVRSPRRLRSGSDFPDFLIAQRRTKPTEKRNQTYDPKQLRPRPKPPTRRRMDPNGATGFSDGGCRRESGRRRRRGRGGGRPRRP